MVHPRFHERTQSAKAPTQSPGGRKDLRRYVTVTARLARLERMANDPDRVAALVSDGRYLRLCAAIARASEAAEQARTGVEAAQAAHRVLH